MIAIQGTYSKITTALLVSNQYLINPFDLYGNLLNEMTIEVDSTLASPTIFLPLISDLNNNWNIKINIIALTGNVLPVTLAPLSPDKIGSAPVLFISANGSSIETNPVSKNNWAANITA